MRHSPYPPRWSLLVLLLSLLLALPLSADDGKRVGAPLSPDNHAVGALFKRYARHSKATLIRLDAQRIQVRTPKPYNIDGLSRVISLTLNKPTRKMISEIEEALEADRTDSDDIQEVFSGSYLISAYYKLDASQRESSYLLYRYNTQRARVTLIYLQGEIDSTQLLKILNQDK